MKKILLMAALALVTTASAAAADTKTYAGVACQPEFDEYDARRWGWGTLTNTSGDNQAWRCPITRDTEGEWRGGLRGRVDLIVPARRTITCTLVASDRAGSWIRFDRETTNPGESGPLIFSTAASRHLGKDFLNCDLPPNASIQSYEATEL